MKYDETVSSEDTGTICGVYVCVFSKNADVLCAGSRWPNRPGSGRHGGVAMRDTNATNTPLERDENDY